jgi:hypothetical protein
MMNNNCLLKFSQRALQAIAVIGVLVFLLPQISQAQQRGEAARPGVGNSDKDTSHYNKHDFNGLWARNPSAQFNQPACPECRDTGPSYGYFGDIPPMTPEGEQRFRLNKPTKGYTPGSEEAERNKNIHIGYRRAVQAALSNDPEERCEPLGLMRLVTFSGGNAPMQIVQTDEIIVQRFEWFWDNREIWTDGRKPPKVEDYGPRFNGYSEGDWEGDTLVVTTVGLDDRQWVDAFGFPVSDQAVLEERYTRPSPNRLRLEMTLTDPANYTRPWKSTPKVWGKIPKESMSIGGWAGLVEDRCNPAENSFFRSFEPPAPAAHKETSGK